MSAKLYIPKPCHENWDKMTPAEKGRHCDACNKVVKDLTGLNKMQAIQVIANSGEREVCGRVDTKILDVKPSKWNTLFSYLKRYGTQAVAFLGLIVVSKRSHAQTDVFVTTGIVHIPTPKSKVESKKYRLTVIVKNNKGEAIKYARVEVSGKSDYEVYGVTNNEGVTHLHFDEEQMNGNSIKLNVTCIGFESTELNDLHLIKSNTTLEMILSEQTIELPAYNLNADKITLKCGNVTTGRLDMMGLMTGIVEELPVINPNDSDSVSNIIKTTEKPLSFKCYPDPTDGIVTIESNKSYIFDLQIFDNSGKMLGVIFQSADRKEIDLSGHPAGLYYVTILSNGVVIDTKKVILVK